MPEPKPAPLATATVLVVDDDPAIRSAITRMLEAEGHRTEQAESAEEALDELARLIPDVVCLDLGLPGMSGLEALGRIVDMHPRLPVIILTGDREVETVVNAMQKGAYDYIPKPPDRTKLTTTVRNAAEKFRLALRVQSLEREAQGPQYRGIVGKSVAMQGLFRQLDRVAGTDVTVLVRGESGTGKELVARAIHESSNRANGPFVALNCAAVPESLQESEFFGHEKGAFTGAVAQRKGRFELANGGTLFLDEIGELSPALQAKLLRVLQERTFQRVGGSQDIRSDFRLVTATHRDLTSEVEASRFRADLYFRLAVFELELPALRERHGDIALLARAFLQAGAAGRKVEIDDDALAVMDGYGWPGNVRELENAMQRALVVCQNDRVTLEDLPARLRGGAPSRSSGPPPEVASTRRPTMSMEEAEKRALEQALSEAKGNVSEAVRLLGIGRTTAYRLMKKYGIRA